jgi:hypothetical protein
MYDQLLTLDEAAASLRLRSADNFARFARRHGIPLVRLGCRVVRVRASDLARTVERNRDRRTAESFREGR